MEFEEKCEKCHINFEKRGQTPLCLDCHEKVAEDQKNADRYHGKFNYIREAECYSCHTEHIGRSEDVIRFDKDSFDHNSTSYELLNSHLKLECQACHSNDVKYRDTPKECISCHKERDVHKESLGKECNACHQETSWNEVLFDHDKTEFKLIQRHKEITCESCHTDITYKNAPKLCIGCHRIDDKHQGSLGSKCENCHQENEWKIQIFSHDKDTKFPLRKAHEKVECISCHAPGKEAKEVGKTCASCHAESDAHAGRYGTKCEQCHSETKWTESIFDHDTKTDFSLKGSHKKLTCIACHQTEMKDEKSEITCIKCHAGNDIHEGKQGFSCERCHGQTAWTDEMRFDHGLTQFPLIGLHEVVPCSSCHIDGIYEEAEKNCFGCHQQDDPHETLFSDNCSECHNPNGWDYWQFDHNKKTEYPLEGSHELLSCGLCHKSGEKEEKPSKECVDCHSIDDVHQGELGRECQRCHIPESFQILILDNRS